MIQKLFLYILFLTTILSGCAVSSSNSIEKPSIRKGGFMGWSKVPEVVVEHGNALKNQPNKMIIGSFKVGFVTDTKVKSSSHSMVGSQGHATAVAHLKGLTTEAMQTITDELYAQFVQDLKDKGYSVALSEELANEPSFAALQDAGMTPPQEGIVLAAAPDAKFTYLAPKGSKVVFFFGEKKAVFDISTDTIKKVQELSEKSGAAVLNVNYTVNFINGVDNGGMTSAAVKVSQGITFTTGSTISYYRGKNSTPAIIRLGQPTYSMGTFCTIENITSAAAKGARVTANIATALMGGGTFQVEEYNFNVTDSQAFIKGSFEAGKLANDKLVGKISGSKSLSF